MSTLEGKNFGSDPRAAAEVTRTVKAVTKKRVFMKLSPNVTDIAEIARACADAGADGICLINTLLGMRIDLKTKKPLIANRTGGLSGPAVFPVAVRMVWDVYEAVQLPIIGCGGVSSAEDVCEMMLAGPAPWRSAPPTCGTPMPARRSSKPCRACAKGWAWSVSRT